jgi:hypothetical protein
VLECGCGFRRLWVPAVAAGALVGLLAGCSGQSPEPTDKGATMTITVSSSAFTDGGTIPSRYTCDGEEVSPPLTFGGLLSGVRETALLVEDPDAPHNSRAGMANTIPSWGV